MTVSLVRLTFSYTIVVTEIAPHPGRALNPTEFANLVNVITSAFGDPTRRNIYLATHENPGGVTAGDIAKLTGLHANVARHHLDKLVAGGYLETSLRPSTGAGRPAKVYTATERGLNLNISVGHDDILVTLLGRALARLSDEEATELATEVGVEFGRKMALDMVAADGHAELQQSFQTALHTVADALSSHGFAAHAQHNGVELRIVSSHCPFGDVAIEHPVICAVDRGMVQGLLSELYGQTDVSLGGSVAHGDDECVTDVHLPLT